MCCLLCGHEKSETLAFYDAPDVYERAVGVPQNGYHRAWVRCSECGFIYSVYSRSPEVLDRLYESGYRDGIASHRRQGTTKEIFERVIALPPEESETVARVKWIKDEIGRLTHEGLRRRTPGTQILLDIGGATGVFAYTFRDDDWQAEIIDPAESGRFVEEYGVTYHECPYVFGIMERAVDLASLVFVLEHLRDPNKILRDIGRDLAPGGMVYIEVPDALAFEMKPADDDIFNSCHLWMFDPRSLTELLRLSGLQVLSLRRGKTTRGHLALSALATRS